MLSPLETKRACSQQRSRGWGQSLPTAAGSPSRVSTDRGQVRDWPHSGWRQGKGRRLLGAHSPCTVPHGYCRAFIILLPIFSSSVLPMTANGRCAWNRGHTEAQSRVPGERHRASPNTTFARLWGLAPITLWWYPLPVAIVKRHFLSSELCGAKRPSPRFCHSEILNDVAEHTGNRRRWEKAEY